MKAILIFAGLFFILNQDSTRRPPNEVMPLDSCQARIEIKQTNDTGKANKAEKFIQFKNPKIRDI